MLAILTGNTDSATNVITNMISTTTLSQCSLTLPDTKDKQNSKNSTKCQSKARKEQSI